ncbi:hypothetical protein C5748_18200 [Phyllobacterium phragmitis]|uniref:HTH iclR-type domain-containing protein n=1 Tax=Phyllobacterium phragmitis TaxID=2670329 RepID=A0A2S9INI7_9HYPH|nr:hypothetical protein C5748_18200 [Phyllobacterium phragmitis]
MLLDLRRLVVARNRPSEETFIQFAVRLGEYEGRPVNAAEIAEMANMPRTSVIRHLNVLEARGRIRADKIGRRVVRRPPQEDFPENKEFYLELERIVRRACSALSRMDTLAARHKE